MRESTAAVVALVVETTRRPGDQVLPHQQHFRDHQQAFLHHRCTIAGLVEHLSPYTGRISD